MALHVSDGDLRKQLQSFGVDVGPITDSTRSIYIKKLQTYLNGDAGAKSKRRKSTVPAKASPIVKAESSVTERSKRTSTKRHTLAAGELKPLKAKSTHGENNISGPAKTRSYRRSLVQEDDSTQDEDDAPLSNSVSYQSKKRERKSLVNDVSDQTDSSVRRRTLNSTPYTVKGRTNGNSDLELSETITSKSKEQNESGRKGTLSKFLNPQKVLATSAKVLPWLTRSAETSNFDTYSDTEEETDTPANNSSLDKDLHAIINNPLRKVSNSIWAKHIHDESGDLANGHSSTAIKYDSKKSTTSDSKISMILLVLAVAFFVIVGCVYYINIKSKSSIAIVKDTFPICNGEFNENVCIPEEKLQSVVELLRPLDEIISKHVETYYCNIIDAPTDTRMQVDVALHNLAEKIRENLEERRAYLLTLLIHNPHWAISCHGAQNYGFPKTSQDVEFLSLREYSVSYACLVKFYTVYIMWKLAFIIIVGVLVYGVYRLVQHYFSSRVAAEEEVYELVDQIVRKLEENQRVNSETPYLAVNHVRDMLIPLAQRPSRITQWNRACNIIEEMESRVRIEFQLFSGEEYKVWRWLPKQESPSTAPSARCSNGRVWQGQAFEKNTAKYSPTPCLKIRNMFDSDVELGEDWLQCVQDSILEKCEEAAVLHIAIDRHSKEGTTYVKCRTPLDAGRLYNALHGWWFDGNLVTVKYLTLDRYHERFPLAVSSTTPLTPSNDEKRSLQAPYHRSALEHT